MSRAKGQHTKDYLADELAKVGLDELAARARTGEFHDYLSPHALPEIELINELNKIGGPATKKILNRLINGEFDASREESDEWAKSPEGQELMRHFTGGSNRAQRRNK